MEMDILMSEKALDFRYLLYNLYLIVIRNCGFERGLITAEAKSDL